MIKKERLPIVFLAMVCLLAGLEAGLTRIGWDLPVLPITVHHGAIMVGGFLGTLIALEKIIPLRKKSLYLIPALNALSIVFFFTHHPKASLYILVISSMALALVFLYYILRQRSIIYVLMLLGAICWLTGNILLLTKRFYPLAFPWWTAFALFIIAAERIELMKFLPVSNRNKRSFLVILFCFVIGALFSFHGFGNLVCGLALIGASLWLIRNDMIGINLRKNGLQQYIGVSLLAGYIAMLLTGSFFLVLSGQSLTYDAIVHSFFIGFVFSMIFAHGPIMLPAILGISVTPFNKILYLWLALLQSAWLLRVFADVWIAMETRKISGLLSAIAILGYFATIVILLLRRRSDVEAR